MSKEDYLRGKNHAFVIARDIYMYPQFLFVRSKGKKGKEEVDFEEFKNKLNKLCKESYGECEGYREKGK